MVSEYAEEAATQARLTGIQGRTRGNCLLACMQASAAEALVALPCTCPSPPINRPPAAAELHVQLSTGAAVGNPLAQAPVEFGQDYVRLGAPALPRSGSSRAGAPCLTLPCPNFTALVSPVLSELPAGRPQAFAV